MPSLKTILWPKMVKIEKKTIRRETKNFQRLRFKTKKQQKQEREKKNLKRKSCTCFSFWFDIFRKMFIFKIVIVNVFVFDYGGRCGSHITQKKNENFFVSFPKMMIDGGGGCKFHSFWFNFSSVLILKKKSLTFSIKTINSNSYNYSFVRVAKFFFVVDQKLWLLTCLMDIQIFIL